MQSVIPPIKPIPQPMTQPNTTNAAIATNAKSHANSDPGLQSQTLFTDLHLEPQLLKALVDLQYSVPTPIQQQSIPKILAGHDLIGAAQTGTGKTAAFALPILNQLILQPKLVAPKTARVLVISPTRELAQQIYQSFLDYGKYSRTKTAVVFGGVDIGRQIKAVAAGVDVLVATPGRLVDLINRNYLKLSVSEIFVLDEADRMLDMGFLPDVNRIIKLLPQKRQNLFFSATMPNEIKKLADSFLKNPQHVAVTPVASTVELIRQSVMFVERSRKKDLLLSLLKNPEFKRVIIFTRTKHGANRLSETLAKNQIKSQAIHGNKSQTARQHALENLKSGQNRVLVATDIVARGIDIDEITHVINYEMPNHAESYVHRIGRTARAGHSGIAISLCDAEEKSFLKDIEKLIKQEIHVERDHTFHSDQVENARLMSSGKAKASIESKQNRRPASRGGGRGGGSRGGGGGAGGSKSNGSSGGGWNNRRSGFSARPKAPLK